LLEIDKLNTQFPNQSDYYLFTSNLNMADNNDQQPIIQSYEDKIRNYLSKSQEDQFFDFRSFEQQLQSVDGDADDSHDVKLKPQQFQTPASRESGVHRPTDENSSKSQNRNSGFSGSHGNHPPKKPHSYTPIQDDELDDTHPSWDHNSVSEIYYNYNPPNQRSHQMERVTTQPALEEDQQSSQSSHTGKEHHLEHVQGSQSEMLPPTTSNFVSSQTKLGLTTSSLDEHHQQPPTQSSTNRQQQVGRREAHFQKEKGGRRGSSDHQTRTRTPQGFQQQNPPQPPPRRPPPHQHFQPPPPQHFQPPPGMSQTSTPSFVVMTDEYGRQSCVSFSELMTSRETSFDREVEKAQLQQLGILTPVESERGTKGYSDLSPMEWILEVKYLMERNPNWRQKTTAVLSKLHRRIIEDLLLYHPNERLEEIQWEDLASNILELMVPEDERQDCVAAYMTAKQGKKQPPTEFYSYLVKTYEKASFFASFELTPPDVKFYYCLWKDIRTDVQLRSPANLSTLELVTTAQNVYERTLNHKQNKYLEKEVHLFNKIILEEREDGKEKEQEVVEEEKEVREGEEQEVVEEKGEVKEEEQVEGKEEEGVVKERRERVGSEDQIPTDTHHKKGRWRKKKWKRREEEEKQQLKDHTPNQTLPTSGDGTLLIQAKVHGLEKRVMIDTGATTSFISLTEVEERNLRTKKRKKRKITLPDGFQIKEEGVLKLSVELQGIPKRLSILFHVVKMDIPAIIGFDVLQENHITIDCGMQTLSYTPPVDIPTKIQLRNWMQVEEEEEDLKNVWDLDKYGPSKEEVEHFLVELSEEMKEAVLKTGIIPEEDTLPPPSKLPKINLNTGNTPPKRSHQRPMNKTKYAELRKQTQLMLQGGIIEEVLDPEARKWQSNILMVSQPPRDPRFCLDPSYVNKHLIVEEFALPLVKEIVEGVARGKYYSTLDLSKAYWQVEVAEEDKEKLVFKVDNKYYRFNRLPFGLKSASFHIQSHLSDWIEEDGVFLYIDDIVISADTQEEHDTKLLRVLEKLKRKNLMINVKKSHLNKREIQVLGHKVKEGRILPLDSRIQSVANWPSPTNREDLVTFVSLLNYHSNLIPNLARRSEPLQRLRRKGTHFKMTDETRRAFNDLRSTLSDPAAMLRPALNNEKFHIEVDASTQGTGAVLFQLIEGEKRIIAYTSSALSAHEQHIHASELEALAAIRALEAFREITYGQPIALYTDNEALSWILEQQSPSPKQMRWILRMLEYNVVFHHIIGEENEAADALSRRPLSLNMLTMTHAPLQDLLEETKEHEGWKALKEKLESGRRVHPKQRKYVADHEAGTFLADGEVYKTIQNQEGQEQIVLVVSPEVGKKLISYYHDHPFFGGHLGIAKTLQKVKAQTFWGGMDQDVYNHITTCQTCQESKPDNTPGLTHHFETPDDFNKMLSIDVMKVGRSDAGPQYFLIMVDHFTKFGIAVPLLNQTAEAVTAALLHSWVQHFGPPKSLLSDQAAIFEGDLFNSTLSNLGIEKLSTEGYSSKSNGLCERVGGIVQQIMRTIVPKDDVWDLFLPFATSCYNTSLNQDLGMSPHEALFGRSPTYLLIDLPLNTKLGRSIKWRVKQIRKMVTKRLRGKERKKEQTFQRKKGRRGKNRTLEVGKMAWVKRRTTIAAAEKTQPIYEGPYRIIRQIRESHWELDLPKNKQRGISSNIFHRRHLKAHKPTEGQEEYVGRFIWKKKSEVDAEKRRDAAGVEEHKEN